VREDPSLSESVCMRVSLNRALTEPPATYIGGGGAAPGAQRGGFLLPLIEHY
jgi:hypothetical protein